MYCYKSRFRGYSKYLESKVDYTSDSNLIKKKKLLFFPSVGTSTAETLNFSTLCLKNWWVRKNSNLRPPLYQSGILTN